MYEIYPYFTNDGSVGLFSPQADDIYHSMYGAFSEAYEKFILPANLDEYLKKNNEIKILDLCFGIGYNTKSFLNFLYDYLNIDTIDTDNIVSNDKIYANNILFKVFVQAIDLDKNLPQLSPFFIANKKSVRNNKLFFNNKKIAENLSNKFYSEYVFHPETNYILFEKMKKYLQNDIKNLLFNKKYFPYFDPALLALYSNFIYNSDKLYPFKHFIAFLHNI